MPKDDCTFINVPLSDMDAIIHDARSQGFEATAHAMECIKDQMEIDILRSLGGAPLITEYDNCSHIGVI